MCLEYAEKLLCMSRNCSVTQICTCPVHLWTETIFTSIRTEELLHLHTDVQAPHRVLHHMLRVNLFYVNGTNFCVEPASISYWNNCIRGISFCFWVGNIRGVRFAHAQMHADLTHLSYASGRLWIQMCVLLISNVQNWLQQVVDRVTRFEFAEIKYIACCWFSSHLLPSFQQLGLLLVSSMST